jgi:parallel beta-helix repeat protein
MRTLLACITLGLIAAAAPAGAGARTIDVRQGDSIQAAVDRARPGDRVEIHPGTYSEAGRTCPTRPEQQCAVVVTRNRISIAGRPRPGKPVVLQSRAGQERGIAVGKSRLGVCLSRPDELVHGSRIARLTVRGFEDDGILLMCVERWRVTRVRAIDNSEYGIYPVQTKRGRLDHSFASGANDTGIYVGQSRNARIDHNLAVDNVSGYELENTVGVTLEDNVARANTGGVLVFALPGLSQKRTASNLIRRNVIDANNRANTCGEPSEVVCRVPSGTGVLVLAADSNRIRSNTVTANRTVGIAVANYCVVLGVPAEECAQLDIDPNPDANRVVGNHVMGNGGDPDLERLPIPQAAADLAWDGTGSDNCWSANEMVASTFPPTLPACS